jgi:dihydrolipoamide dehydrogenase
MSFRITVLGSGPGGYVAALEAARRGAEVTLIEKAHIGGTCLNWGCIPSKVLKTATETLERFKRAKEMGIHVNGTVEVSLEALMARKQAVVKTQAGGILKLLKHRKVRLLQGEGTISGPGRLSVRSLDGEVRDVEWDKLILATGTVPQDLPGLPFDGKRILSSNHALEIPIVPERLLILGGGVIGCEFASIFSSLGSRVTVVEALPRLLPLPSLDSGCSKVLQREMKKRKITVFLNRSVESLEHRDGGLRVRTVPSSVASDSLSTETDEKTVDVDALLVCVGRRACSDTLGLETVGVETEEKGWIPVDRTLKTAHPDIYAIGDALGPSRPMLAHMASAEALVAVENALGGSAHMDYRVVPSAVFTSPEVACVGLSPGQAEGLGLPARTDRVLFRNLGKAQVMSEIAGEASIVSDPNSGRVLGIHMIGPHATDLIGEAALALRKECTVQDLAGTIHPHPTLTEIIMETSLKALDRSLHG